MRIGVISDTHIPVRQTHLPAEIEKIFSKVDYIFHAGDIEEPHVLTELESIAPVHAVAGNMDFKLPQLPGKIEICLENQWIGMIHGKGTPRATIRDAIRKEFSKATIIVYGHTHQAFWGMENNIWFMNPGSPTDTTTAPYRSLGLIEILQGKIQGEIIRL